MRTFGQQCFDKLGPTTALRIEPQAEEVEPIDRSILGMHLMRNHPRQVGDLLRQQIAEPRALAAIASSRVNCAAATAACGSLIR